jgi:hypothetical protein
MQQPTNIKECDAKPNQAIAPVPSLKDAFTHLTQVGLIPPATPEEGSVQTYSAASSKRHRTLSDRIKDECLFHYESAWDGPAHFPLPRFGVNGERVDREGVVIYEGMRFLALPDGRYEVSFIASTPAMPVTLRLQLHVMDDKRRTFSLTLPPITIEPKKDFTGNYLGSTYRVRHEGYSRSVANAFGSLEKSTIIRRGTARFGSWPEGIERFETLSTIAVPTQTLGSTQASDSAAPGDAIPSPSP